MGRIGAGRHHPGEHRERSQTIRASEVGDFTYCARSWWLRRVAGEEPAGHERRAAGVVLHARHGRAVSLSSAMLWMGVIALAAGLLLFLVS